MIILGLSFGFHDSAAALIIDGEFVAGSCEERFTRIKHDYSFPINAINHALTSANISFDELDAVTYYESSVKKFSRIVESSFKSDNFDFLHMAVSRWAEDDCFDIKGMITKNIPVRREMIHEIPHHTSHAAGAFYLSPFHEAAVLCLDAVGESETITMWKGEGPSLQKLTSYCLPESIGLFYSAFTSFLGFEVNEGEYKVMGMAAYGEPNYYDKVKKTISWDDDGYIAVNHDYFDFLTPKKRMFTDKLIDLFGERRSAQDVFFTDKYSQYAPKHIIDKEYRRLIEKNKYYADIASSVQKVTEEIIVTLARKVMKMAGSNNLCMSGGVALNSCANGVIQQTLKPAGYFIHPAAGDDGSSAGSALSYYYSNSYKPARVPLKKVYVGKGFDAPAIEDAILLNWGEYKMIKDIDMLLDHVVDLLVNNNVIGWYNNRCEWGPRALGNRSIIADPRSENMKNIVNEKIKYRELFRPFAPSVLAEEAANWFELGDASIDPFSPFAFMLGVVPVKKNCIDKIPAVVHADNSARIQLVFEEVNPLYYKLINKFYKRTGVPLLLNTSFNLKGEPIVNTPFDALNTFSYSDMDYVVMNPFIIETIWKSGESDE